MKERYLEIDQDDNLFIEIIESIAEEYKMKIRRVPRMHRENDTFYMTVLTQNYMILEIKLTMIEGSALIYGLPAFETEVTVY